MLVARFAANTLIVFTPARSGAVFSVAARRVALTLRVADSALGAFVVTLTVDTAAKLSARWDGAAQLAWVVVSTDAGGEQLTLAGVKVADLMHRTVDVSGAVAVRLFASSVNAKV